MCSIPDAISTSIVDPYMREHGWVFGETPGATPDELFGSRYLYQIYQRARPDYTGRVMGSLQQKRGQVEGINSRPGQDVIKATVPLLEMFGYMTELRSATKGQGSFTMEFSHFDQAPPETLQKYGIS